MIEKLLENWLDSASERSYQAVFVQMLAAKGYTILHSTRHCLLEFGKDILAIAPDGVGCAFQLKGDPCGRMKIAEFRRDIQPQLVQLMGQSPSYPGFPSGPHRAYLVSNGHYEEEVQAAVREMNASPYPAKLELWSRGHLFDLCKGYGAALWPSELKDNRALLELYMANPKDQLPIETFASMLESVLSLDDDKPVFNRSELIRAASSAAWLTGISVATFAESENHQAVALGWTLCCVMLVGAAERHAGADVSSVELSFTLAKNALVDALANLWEEIAKRNHLVEGDAFTDPEIHAWRIGILYGLLSSLAIADSEMSLLDENARDKLRVWLTVGGHRPDLWGEAAVANLMPWLIWLRKNDASLRPDAEIHAVTEAVIKLNQAKSNAALPGPYYGFDSVLRDRLELTGATSHNDLERETFAGSAYTAEALLHLLVRTNMKRWCKALWSDFTKLSHLQFCLDEARHYCMLKAPTGVSETKIYPSTYEWRQLKQDAIGDTKHSRIPTALRTCPWLLAMWWQVAPHRMNSEATRVFAEAMLPGWGS